MSTSTHDRTYDVVVYGATGFTGRLVAEHLAASAEASDLRWAIAGRNKGKLHGVLDGLSSTGATKPDVLVADATDADSVRAMAEQTKVVCSTVGPYALYGTPVVKACAESGTHYCDLTGEVHWARAMIDAYGAVAARSGAQILHSCGFDSIPSDLGVYYTQQQMKAQTGSYATTISGRLKGFRGGASGGTIHSALNFLDEAGADPAVAEILSDPYALNPRDFRGPDSDDSVLPGRSSELGAFSAPFVMAMINTRVVRRTNALLTRAEETEGWGEDFSYDEALLTGGGPIGAATAVGLAAGMLVGQTALKFGPLRSLARRVVPEPGTGPSESAREKGYWDFRFVARNDAGDTLKTKVVGQGDPGYLSTSRMLGETALALAAGESKVGGGSWTPAAAVGDSLLTRLATNADVTFDMID